MNDKIKEDKDKIKDPSKHKKLFEKLQKCIRFDNDKKGFILDTKEHKHKELNKYFKCKSPYEANLLLKIWLHRLQEEKIEDETDDDAMIKFFQLRYFLNNMNYDPIRNTERKRKGMGNSNKE